MLYTLDEVAYLQVHPSTVRNLVKRRALPFFRIGRVYRFDKDEIDRWRFWIATDAGKFYGRYM